jgi:hypothetical protein
MLRTGQVVDSAAANVAVAEAGAEEDFVAEPELQALELSSLLSAAFESPRLQFPLRGDAAPGAAAGAPAHQRPLFVACGSGELLPAAGGAQQAAASAARYKAVGALLGKAFVESVPAVLPLAPAALRALLGRLGGGAPLGGAWAALALLEPWAPQPAARLRAELLGGGPATEATALAAAG